MRRVLWLLAAWSVLFAPRTGLAQNWYDVIFPEKSHDFGTVARGSKIQYTFKVVNTTASDVHIASWRTKCGCTDVQVGARDIPPGTQTTIEVTLDTTRFNGYKASGLTLIFDRPEYREVDLNLTSFIRADVMLNPGAADFGVVPRGSSRALVLNLTYYGGHPDWQITRLTTVSDDVAVEGRVVSRAPGAAVQYQLTVTLKSSAPSGEFKDEINLATNDPESPNIPISVTAHIQAAVSIAPSSILNLGRLRPGQEVRRTVLVKSSKPFKITRASSPKSELTASGQLGEARPFHTVTVTFKAPEQPGPYNAVLEFATDLQDEPPAKLSAFATIVP